MVPYGVVFFVPICRTFLCGYYCLTCVFDRIFSILNEYGKYCCLVLSSCMSLRLIVRSVSLRQVSLRSIPSSFTVNLDRVKVRIGQMYRHDGSRIKHTCRPRTEYPSICVVRVEAHEWNSVEHTRGNTQIVITTQYQHKNKICLYDMW